MSLDVHGADSLYLGFLYSVTLKNAPDPVAGFNEVSGLTIETEVETLREGGVNGYEQQIPGPAKYSSRLVLKRGIGDLAHLWEWYAGVLQARIERRDVTITMLDSQGKPGIKWVFKEACPVKWTGPELRANTSAVAFESVELVHHGVDLGVRR
jgi:phage tail-like protein